MKKILLFLFCLLVTVYLIAKPDKPKLQQDSSSDPTLIKETPLWTTEKFKADRAEVNEIIARRGIPLRDILVIDDPRIPEYIRNASPDNKTRSQILEGLSSYPASHHGEIIPGTISRLDHLTKSLDVVPENLVLALLNVAMTEGKYYGDELSSIIKTLSNINTVESAEALILIYKYAPIIVEHRLKAKYDPETIVRAISLDNDSYEDIQKIAQGFSSNTDRSRQLSSDISKVQGDVVSSALEHNSSKLMIVVDHAKNYGHPALQRHAETVLHFMKKR